MNGFDLKAAILAALFGSLFGFIAFFLGVAVAMFTGNEQVFWFALWISGFLCGFVYRLAYVEARKGVRA